MQVPVVFSARNSSGSFLDMSPVPAFASFSPNTQPGPPPVTGNPNVAGAKCPVHHAGRMLAWLRRMSPDVLLGGASRSLICRWLMEHVPSIVTLLRFGTALAPRR